MGVLGRIVAIALGLLIAFIVLGGALEACGATEDKPEEPPVTSSVDPSPPASPDATGLPTADTEVPTVPTATDTETETATEEATSDPPESSPAADVYYENCDEARAAGAAPVFAGDPGYGPHLDRDGDGVACEP
ncbi:excalibur calcium-binding domain-containing protein [Streptomyces sp. NPDC007907]|uniref:excalibur calcium-binding domain-containing protein n=1 Tax=Streptomyces sp. NPDC007907 TaxID=3364789 RepID=UPI0036E96F32